MAADKHKPPTLTVETFTEYQVISQPNPLRTAIRRVDEDDKDDPIARAEEALAGLSGEFTDWMAIECERLATAYEAILKDGFTVQANEEFFRAAHDVRGHAATFGYPVAAAAAESLCRIIEHAPHLNEVPADLLAHHVSAIQAITREHDRLDRMGMASELSGRLRRIADKYLIEVNHDRPEHLEAILAPSIVPGE